MNYKSSFIHSNAYSREYLEAYYNSKSWLDSFKWSFWFNLIVMMPISVFVFKMKINYGMGLGFLILGLIIAFMTFDINSKAKQKSNKLSMFDDMSFKVEIQGNKIIATINGEVLNVQSLVDIKRTKITDNFQLLVFKDDTFIPVFLEGIGDVKEQRKFIKKIRNIQNKEFLRL